MNAETIFIAFGSNLGNRQDLCDRAVALMRLLPHSTFSAVSSYYETEPVDMEPGQDHPWFYNGVVRLETRLPPERVLTLCQETEQGLGRDRVARNGSRTMDLDVLFYGQQVINSKNPPLVIPHPRLHQRRFVLAPMAELAPDWVHPQYARTMQALLDALTDAQQVRKLDLVPGSCYATRSPCVAPPAS